MKKAIITIGIPASGKSTWAKEYCISHENYMRINKDDIRQMLSANWGWQIEFLTKKIQNNIIKIISEHFDNIIIDNTHLNENSIKYISDILKNFGYDVNYKVFEISLNEALLRNKKRINSVPEEVIINFYNSSKEIIEKYKIKEKCQQLDL